MRYAHLQGDHDFPRALRRRYGGHILHVRSSSDFAELQTRSNHSSKRFHHTSNRAVHHSQTDPLEPDIYNLTWLSEPGGAYEIESSAELGIWQTLQGEFLAIGDTTSVSLTMGGLGDHRFIRVRKIG